MKSKTDQDLWLEYANKFGNTWLQHIIMALKISEISDDLIKSCALIYINSIPDEREIERPTSKQVYQCLTTLKNKHKDNETVMSIVNRMSQWTLSNLPQDVIVDMGDHITQTSTCYIHVLTKLPENN